MSHLVLELRPGEMMVVNGATIRFRSKCRIELVSQARFLFGKQIMAADEAETAIRLLYYKMQTAYVGPAEDRDAAAGEVRLLLARMVPEATSTAAIALSEIEQAFVAGNFYQALRNLRVLVRAENPAAGADSGPL